MFDICPFSAQGTWPCGQRRSRASGPQLASRVASLKELQIETGCGFAAIGEAPAGR
jgi:hypothetical protein